MYIYVYVYIYIYAYTYIYTHTYIYTYILKSFVNSLHAIIAVMCDDMNIDKCII